MRQPTLSVVRLTPNRGLGGALRAGFAARDLLRGWRAAEVPAALETRQAGVSKLRRWAGRGPRPRGFRGM